MTDVEYERLHEDADVAAVDLAALARSRITAAEIPRRARRKSADHQALARVLAHLGQIGNNLNQGVKAAKSYGDLAALHSVGDLKAELAAIRRMVHDALAP